MSDSNCGSVTLWLAHLKEGDEEAAELLWQRYFQRLAALARVRLQNATHVVDEEDVAHSALNSVFMGARNGKFPQLNNRTELWPLLVTITLRKATNALKRQFAQRRSPQAEDRAAEMTKIIDDEPDPALITELADELRHLMQILGDEVLIRIAQLRLEGYTVAEIASEVELGQRTVARKIARIRQEWEEEAS